jgi:hypothetical protein
MRSRLVASAGVTALVLGSAAAVTAPGVAAASAVSATSGAATTTPIKHVIVIIGENHSFDNIFATYSPPGHQLIDNLLSEGIVTPAGAPGPNWYLARQLTASDTGAYTLTPQITGTYRTLPQPNTTYVSTGCDGLPMNSPDTRFPTLPNRPFQITKYVPYYDTHAEYTGGCEFAGAYVGDPIHRFYQMWQQTTAYHGGLNTWVANTAGDDNGAIPPEPIYQGGLSMGFYNCSTRPRS